MYKVCFVATLPGTLKAFVLELAIAMHLTGLFDITFLSNPDREFENNLPSFIHYVPIKMKRGISFDGFSAYKKMLKVFKKEKFDLVQYSTPNASCYASFAAKKAKIPVRLYCQWGIVYVGFSGLKRAVFKRMEKSICRNSTMIEPDSKSNLSFSINEKLYKKEKGRVVWNGSACGIDLTRFNIRSKDNWRKDIRKKYNINETSFVYGFVGRITGDKGINELISSFKKIFENDKSCYLLFVGNKEASSSINQELLMWAKECPNVIFTGFISDVERYLSAMDVFVLPSYREGFGLGTIEAESMEIPVIVTNIPGPMDAIIDNVTGLFVEKKNIDQLFDKMLFLKNNPEFAKQLGLNGRRFAVDSFNQIVLFDKIIEDRIDLIEKSFNLELKRRTRG